MSFTVVIPARYASTRLPGKPLLPIAGKPMIEHVYERALASGAQTVVIATDDERVYDVARAFGARVEMTAAHHRSGTERIAEVVARMALPTEQVVVNVQGDEPMLPPALVHQVAANLTERPGARMATLCEPITEASALFDPAVVKVVFDRSGFALYFSRAPIPWHRQRFVPALANGPHGLPARAAHYRHIGIYAYRAAYLGEYVAQAVSPLERDEDLEQLRALYHGARVHVAEAAERPGPGVDTPQDLETVRRLMT
ncbi:MAG: 3-deoxy-manno-octulosonate cytidylyltransferase [Gammaproteobacteria bacterium]|nr:3-deoxy-manno-octulosonate cytidylyltransferase [Gammaproteobacteria bacterium]NIR85480.1 3-deoxy-manno-octulosonate cytidylyltransferase [Gammaproteobacteria bacterium]NIR89532.1 3-deoxy-manno-octulosonate cytidylyltransferase [Gammaproteobacteria bacterium]NIU06617.1 3-deoxy-manno-octulosonate cytidylyltransferase [Gammaproteobacteria bacterium]NIV53500.1 3-deoxy-manno-octulosonate cytidylyltransferase [Gammaproteobacteria bacterium]